MYIRKDKNLSFVRLFDAFYITSPVDIYLNGKLIFKELSYKNFTEYIPLTKGSYKFDIYPLDNTEKPILTQLLDLPANEIITVALVGDIDDVQLVDYFELNPKDINEGKTRVRFINLSIDAPAVEVLVDDRMAFDDVGYLDATDYLDIPSGTYKIDINISDTKDRLIQLKSEFKSNKIYTIFIIGDSKNLNTIQSLDGSTYTRY